MNPVVSQLISKIENQSVSQDEICELLRTNANILSHVTYEVHSPLYHSLMKTPNRTKCIDALYTISSYFHSESLGMCVIYLNTDTFIHCIEKGFEMDWNTYNLFLHIKTRLKNHNSGLPTVYREVCKMFRCLVLYSESYFYTLKWGPEAHKNNRLNMMDRRLSCLYSYITNAGLTEAIDFVVTEYVTYCNPQVFDIGEWWLHYILSNPNLCGMLVFFTNIPPFDTHWIMLVDKYSEYANTVKNAIQDVLYTTQFLLPLDVITYCIFPHLFPKVK